ncbi:hypothetical protein M5689_011030 [Euphorbia peplus]|nr:hypothetical protein M5689_011030 [Euphorbia peplus]
MLPEINSHFFDGDLDDFAPRSYATHGARFEEKKVNDNEEAPKVEESYPCKEIKEKNKEKTGEKHHQPNPNANPKPSRPITFNFEKIPKFVRWSLQDADKDFWIPELKSKSNNPYKINNPEKSKMKWTMGFVSFSENRNPTKAWNPF